MRYFKFYHKAKSGEGPDQETELDCEVELMACAKDQAINHFFLVLNSQAKGESWDIEDVKRGTYEVDEDGEECDNGGWSDQALEG